MKPLVLDDLADVCVGDVILVEHEEQRHGSTVVVQRPYYFFRTRQDGWLDVYRAMLVSQQPSREDYRAIPFSAISHIRKMS